MNVEDVAKCKTIADYYGMKPQLNIVIEECSELIKAVCKLNRADPTNAEETAKATSQFIEELADVSIMLEQMKILLNPALTAELNNAVTAKLDRQIGRIESEKELYHRWRTGVTA